MRVIFFHLFLLLLLSAYSASAQETLPGITVKNLSGTIVVSWKNEYTAPLASISIQRSFDSLKNYSTIGSVLNPSNKENGYADAAPPYNKMYYRAFISFENGSFVYSKPVRPALEKEDANAYPVQYAWQIKPEPPIVNPPVVKPASTDSLSKAVNKKVRRESADSGFSKKKWREVKKKNTTDSTLIATKTPEPPKEIKPAIRYVYLNKDNNVTLYLPDAATKKYMVKFFEEGGKEAFTLQKLNEEFLVIERVNFKRSGWFNFEIYDGKEIIEKDKIFVAKDLKPPPDNKKGNK